MSTTFDVKVVYPGGTDQAVVSADATSMAGSFETNLQAELASSSNPALTGISATLTPPVIYEEQQVPQLTKVDVTPEAPHTINPVGLFGAFESIIYRVNGSVVTSGFTEPTRPYTISASFVIADGSNVAAGDFTIPVVYFSSLIDPSAEAFANHSTHAYTAVRFLPYYMDAATHQYDTYVLVEDGGSGIYNSPTTTNDTHMGFYVPKTVLTSNNIAIDSDFNLLFEITVKRGMSYSMTPQETFGFDFDTAFQAHFTDQAYHDGPSVKLRDNGFSINANGTNAGALGNTAGYTKIRWIPNSNGTWPADAKLWPFEGNAATNGIGHAVSHAAGKYYMIVEVKAQQKCTVRFYSHADSLGTASYNPSAGDQEFFYFDFPYPDAFTRDYVFGYVSKSALRIDRMVVTNKQTDLLDLLRSYTAPLHEFKIYAAASSNQQHSGMSNLLINGELPDTANFTFMKAPNYVANGTVGETEAISLFTTAINTGSTNFNNFHPVNPGDHLFTLMAPAGSLDFRFMEGRYAQPLRILKDDVEIHNDTFGVGSASSTTQYITTVNTA